MCQQPPKISEYKTTWNDWSLSRSGNEHALAQCAAGAHTWSKILSSHYKYRIVLNTWQPVKVTVDKTMTENWQKLAVLLGGGPVLILDTFLKLITHWLTLWTICIADWITTVAQVPLLVMQWPIWLTLALVWPLICLPTIFLLWVWQNIWFLSNAAIYRATLHRMIWETTPPPPPQFVRFLPQHSVF